VTVTACPQRSAHSKAELKLALRAVAACVLREAFSQFETNLMALRKSDDPEVVHQARVGWRRFRSALRLFKPALTDDARPLSSAVPSLLNLLGELRDLDVAWHDTLPPLQEAYTAGDTKRLKAWQSMLQALQQAGTRHRQSVRVALLSPQVGADMVATTAWLKDLSDAHIDSDEEINASLRHWSERRMARLHRQLKSARKDIGNPDHQHRLRILAKRMRYSLEALHAFLPERRAKRWRQQATHLQVKLGARRDLMQANALSAKLDGGLEISEFLRGLAIERSSD
jgi:CHAD domain-containing protein